MSAKRAIVSYDDLYDEFDSEFDPTLPTSAPATTTTASTRVRSTITVSGANGDNDSCTSASDCEDEGVPAMQRDWDDRDLIRAWDSTISAYRRQHALMMEDESYRAEQHASESRVGLWARVDNGPAVRKKRRHEPVAGMQAPAAAEVSAEAVDMAGAAGFTGFGVPASEDDALSKLNMSWYYAGYYAGYYQAFRSGIAGSAPASTSASASAEAAAATSAAAVTPPRPTANNANGGAGSVAHPQPRQQEPHDTDSSEHIVIIE
ncbi:hypothetical protein LPJ53_002476 [Coemansia erecta]|uniref:Survival Motor Neuron Gemin2-binding domain-containing protein n=1 Tax=Coemansia erecta TaxID=147472 RepID=A0A9W7XY43_9FUNG|nr:hypothetical protein LPJ53_002476 [Coemansia erecta]